MKSPKLPLDVKRNLLPASPTFTAHDAVHFSTYMQLLTFSSGGASTDEMALEVLGIDPDQDPERAERAVEAHLIRANWLLTSGYKELFAKAD